MQHGLHFEEYFAPVAIIENIRTLLSLGYAQEKYVFILDVKNEFQNTFQFGATKGTYVLLPPFFSEYLHLHRPDHPDIDVTFAYPQVYALKKFHSIQGEKDAGRRWYQLLCCAFRNGGLHSSVADHAVFIWKEPASEMFPAVATDYCLCLVDDRYQFIHLKKGLEELFEFTFQEGDTLQFLNLRIIQSPHGISIDQIYHIVETLLGTYLQDHGISKMLPITSPFPTDSASETTLCESPILMGLPLRKI
jgi:hypothetical protein